MFETIINDQITFSLLCLDDDILLDGCKIECISNDGKLKNVIGDYVLKPNSRYTFSFKIINGLTCKLGIVERKFIDNIRNKKTKLNGAFSDYIEGFSLFSYGYLRNGTSGSFGDRKFKSFSPGDYITMILDSSKGTFSAYINKQYIGVLFFSEKFLTEEFYPAVAINGNNESIIHTFF